MIAFEPWGLSGGGTAGDAGGQGPARPDAFPDPSAAIDEEARRIFELFPPGGPHWRWLCGRLTRAYEVDPPDAFALARLEGERQFLRREAELWRRGQALAAAPDYPADPTIPTDPTHRNPE